MGGHPGCSEVVGWPSRMSGSGQEALPYVREWLGDPPSCPGVVGGPPGCPRVVGVPPGSSEGQPESLGKVGTPSQMSLKGGRPFRMSGSCRVSLSDVREDLPVVREWSGGSPGCSRVVGWPSRMSLSSQEALPNVWEWSGGPLECPGVVESPPWMSGCGQVALPDVREWSGGPPGYPEVVGRPSQMSRSGRESLTDVR